MAVSPRLITATREQLSSRERLLDQNGATHVGWKLGMGDRESIDGHIVVGHITSATVLDPGAAYEVRPEEDLHVDVEAYVEVGAVEGYGVALEIVDLTSLDGEPDSIVATNIFHRAVSFGPPAPAEPSRAEVGLLVNGELRQTNPWPSDIAERLSAAAEVLEGVGSHIEAGDLIITGSIVQLPIAAGDRIAAVIAGATAVALEIA
jgi:hypothetical protein